jgi:hypothetical protein
MALAAYAKWQRTIEYAKWRVSQRLQKIVLGIMVIILLSVSVAFFIR